MERVFGNGPEGRTEEGAEGGDEGEEAAILVKTF